jgi:hypothetical protein
LFGKLSVSELVKLTECLNQVKDVVEEDSRQFKPEHCSEDTDESA